MPSIEFLIEQFGCVGAWHITRRKWRLWGRLFAPNVASGFGKLFSTLEWLGSWTEWLILCLSSSRLLLVSIHWAVLVKHGGEVKNLLLRVLFCAKTELGLITSLIHISFYSAPSIKWFPNIYNLTFNPQPALRLISKETRVSSVIYFLVLFDFKRALIGQCLFLTNTSVIN